MSDPIQILITGASGFVGRAAVTEARRRGHRVVALYRNTLPPDWAEDDGITPLRVDLAGDEAPAQLAKALDGTEAVIHAAAHLGGDAAAHSADTTKATGALLSALSESAARLVLVSSIAVYDTMQLSAFDALTEDSPLESPDQARDSYTQAKLLQEQAACAAKSDLWILRPGAVVGPGRTWHALLGLWASKLFLLIDGGGELPLVHVDHLAEALVNAAQTPVTGQKVVNVFDDDRPSRPAFVAAHKAAAGWPRLVLPIPYRQWLALTRLLKPMSAKLPGLLREPILRARLMPLSYPNTRLRALLGGQDRAPFVDMITDSIKAHTP